MENTISSLNEVLIDYKQHGVRVGLEQDVYFKLFATLVGSFICIALATYMLQAIIKK